MAKLYKNDGMAIAMAAWWYEPVIYDRDTPQWMGWLTERTTVMSLSKKGSILGRTPQICDRIVNKCNIYIEKIKWLPSKSCFYIYFL